MADKSGKDAKNLQLEEFFQKNMPTIKEIAPEEYDKLIELYQIIGNKYAEKAKSLLSERGLLKDDLPTAGVAYMAGAALALGGIVTKEVYDKATGKSTPGP
jgi:hypothetical protein